MQAGDNTYLAPCGSKLLRKTERKGGESRLFSLTVDRTPSLQALGDVDSGVAVTGGAAFGLQQRYLCTQGTTS